MNTIPLIIAIMAGIFYGSIQSIKMSKQEEESAKQAAGMYIKSIILCLVVYLIVSLVMG